MVRFLTWRLGAPTVSVPTEPGRSRMASSDLALEVTWYHSHHVLLGTKEALRLASSRSIGRGLDPHLFMGGVWPFKKLSQP